jgi:hypothetical protein
MAVKDAMRLPAVAAALAETWFETLVRFSGIASPIASILLPKLTNPSTATPLAPSPSPNSPTFPLSSSSFVDSNTSGMLQSPSSYGVALDPSEVHIPVCRLVLRVIAEYIAWCDISLVANDKFLALLTLFITGSTNLWPAAMQRQVSLSPSATTAIADLLANGGLKVGQDPRSLSQPIASIPSLESGIPSRIWHMGLRGSALRVLNSMVHKGMEESARLGLIRGLRVVDVLVDMQKRPGGLQQCGTEEADVDSELLRLAQQKVGITANEAALSVRMAIPALAESSGANGGEDFGVMVGKLICEVGRSLITAGESGSVLGDHAACEWTASALRAVAAVALAVAEQQHPLVVIELLPFLLDVVSCFGKEARAAQAAQAAQAVAAAGDPGLVAPRSPSFAAMSPPPHYGGSGQAPGNAKGGARSTGPSQQRRARSGSGAYSSSVPKGFEGRPAGVSFGPFMPVVLNMIATRFAFPSAYMPPSSSGDVDSDDEDEDDEGLAILELRETLKKIFNSIVRIAPDAVLAHLCSGRPDAPLSPERLTNLPLLSWQEAESALSLLFLFGEGCPAVIQHLRVGSGPFTNSLIAALTSRFAEKACSQSSVSYHHSPLILYHELLPRYSSLISFKPDLLPTTLELLLGRAGLECQNIPVRSRCAYLLLKLIKSLVKSDAKTESIALSAYVDALLRGLERHLTVQLNLSPHLLHFLPGASGVVSSDKTALRMAGGGRAGHASLAPEEQQYLFEAVGVLLGQHWVPMEKRSGYAEAVLNPLIQQLDDGIARLAGDRGHWPPDLVTEVAGWIVRVLNAIAHTTKGFSASIVTQSPNLPSLLERALAGAMRALAVLPDDTSVRGKALFLLHRMVDCMESRLLVHLPACWQLLLSSSSPDDITQVVVFTTQLASKFKSGAAPFVGEVLMSLVARVFEVVPPPPASLTLAPSSTFGRDAGPVGGGTRGSAAVTTEDTRARSELLKNFLLFLWTLTNVNIFTAVVLSTPRNQQQLWDLFNAVGMCIATATDMVAAKTGLTFFGLVIKQWLPIAPPPTSPAAASPVMPSATGGSALPSAGVAPPSASLPSPLPSPLPEDLRPAFFRYACDSIIRATWALAAAPGFDSGDMQTLTAATEAVQIHCSLAVAVAVHAGGSAPQHSDFLAHLCGTLMPALGVPVRACEEYHGKLRNALVAMYPMLSAAPAPSSAAVATGSTQTQQAVRELRQGYVAVARMMRTSGKGTT